MLAGLVLGGPLLWISLRYELRGASVMAIIEHPLPDQQVQLEVHFEHHAGSGDGQDHYYVGIGRATPYGEELPPAVVSWAELRSRTEGLVAQGVPPGQSADAVARLQVLGLASDQVFLAPGEIPGITVLVPRGGDDAQARAAAGVSQAAVRRWRWGVLLLATPLVTAALMMMVRALLRTAQQPVNRAEG